MCGPELPASHLFDLSKPARMSLTLCGSHRPILFYWYSTNTRKLVTNVTASLTERHQYTYVIELDDLRSSDCNSILKYEATGHSTDLTGETRIDLNCKSFL
jgi:hypothetical protein